MITTITKNDLERVLPIAMSSQNGIYEMAQPEMMNQLCIYNMELLGEEGDKLIEESGTNSILYYNYLRLVASSAFLQLMRQMDLVLTPTGFGVVSNDNLSPASKQRVDVLENQLRKTQYISKAYVILFLRGEAWGNTQQAKDNIPYMYDEYDYFVRHDYNDNNDVDGWLKVQQALKDADMYLRQKISDEQLDIILSAYRTKGTADYDNYYSIIGNIRSFYQVWAFRSPEIAKQTPMRLILSKLENVNNAELYKTYLESDAYKINHHESFQNTKDSSAFFFNG